MKKILLYSAVIASCFAVSCSGGAQKSEAEITAEVEKMAKEKVDAEVAKATSDCEARKLTEVKLKSDSIIANTK